LLQSRAGAGADLAALAPLAERLSVAAETRADASLI
jgi:hypothetical protein